MQSPHLLFSGLGLQDVALPDGVEHAALLTKVSEALSLIVPVHLHNTTKHKPSGPVHLQNVTMTAQRDTHLSGQAQDEHGETLHHRGVLVEQ